MKTLYWSWTVQLEHSERADTLILKALEANDKPCAVTRSQLKRLFEEERVHVDGRVAKASLKLRIGMKVEISFPPPVPTEITPENIPIEILYEDEDLAVINKPQGLTVHPSPTQMESTLVHALLHHIKDLSGIGGVLRPGIVHRIDKNTSGALVITKHDLAHTRLVETFSQHAIERAYWALCYGSPESVPFKEQNKEKKKIESLIGRHPTDRKKMSMQVTQGRRAVTYLLKKKEYGISSKKSFASWIEATLETGRTHQVRVHLTGLGSSLLGDPTYGTPTSSQSKWQALPKEIQELVNELPGQALHARILGFKHPITGKMMRFEAEPPVLFTRLLKTLEKYSASVTF